MALQPNATDIDRAVTTPFLLRLYWRTQSSFDAMEFSVAPPSDITGISDYSQLLPSNVRQQSVQIYTWPDCTLAELTSLFMSVLLPNNKIPIPAVGTRLVFSLVFPDTRAPVVDGGRGRWMDKLLGTVVIGGNAAELEEDFANGVARDNLDGDAKKTLAGARFVIGDYIACSILPPGPDGRIAAGPAAGPRAGPRNGGGYGPPQWENGYGRAGGYRGGYGPRAGGSFGAAPPAPPPRGDWRRGERPPGGYDAPRGSGYRGRGGRPY